MASMALPGQDHPKAILRPRDVRTIRRLRGSGRMTWEKITRVIRRTNRRATQAAVEQAGRGDTWECENAHARPVNAHRLTPAERAQVRATDLPDKITAELLGVSVATIRRVRA